MSSLQRPSASDFDAAAARLLAAVTGLSAPERSFALRLQTALEAGLGLLHSDRLLARRVTVTGDGDRELARRLQSWADTYGEVLREAVLADESLVVPRPFLEPHLIAGCACQIRAALHREGSDLRSLVPHLHAFILGYYLQASGISRYYNAFGERAE